MTRLPLSDIPQDIMHEASKWTAQCYQPETGTWFDVRDVIAKAILSERHRHAEVMEEVRNVLESSDALLKRMMHVHVAPDECKDETVAESRRWFHDNGGTLLCLAYQFEATRALLSRLEER